MVLAALLSSGKIRCYIMKFPLVAITVFLLTQVSFSPAWGQYSYEDKNGTLRELIIDPNCKTIQLYREGWPLSYPVINLHADVPLILEFDDLSRDQPSFWYKLYHCNADWTISDLTEQQYLEGFPENELTSSTPSFSTYYSYLHYTLQVPNESAIPLVSGNYLLVVYKDQDPEDVVRDVLGHAVRSVPLAFSRCDLENQDSG